MLVPDPSQRERPPEFRTVASHNLVRILSGEMPIPGERRAPARRAVPVRFTWWQRVLHAQGLYG